MYSLGIDVNRTTPFLITAALLMLLNAACQKEKEHVVEKPPHRSVSFMDQDFIGLEQKKAADLARERKLPSRVVELDGESLVVTADYAPTRINFWIRDGKVIKTSRG